jgi:tRNA modification GTPase
LQGHGGPVIMDALLQAALAMGARLAMPGEFSQRAFLNGKLDLVQVEAIADLINAGSEQAARAAVGSLQGEFSRRVGAVVEKLVNLRVYVEAAIDFAEEDIDFLTRGNIYERLHDVLEQVQAVLRTATQGVLLQEGMRVVIAGKPNSGKSTLLNALAGVDRAIVSAIPGTTRDVLRERINLDGMPLYIFDTAGLRDSEDPVEQEGIRRARIEIEQADHVLFVVDSTEDYSVDLADSWPSFLSPLLNRCAWTLVLNKMDISRKMMRLEHRGFPVIALSAKTGDGMDALRRHLKAAAGFVSEEGSLFVARRRHLDALQRALNELVHAQAAAKTRAGELIAEDLRHAQYALGEITGEFTNEDLLTEIFANFCIGK